MEESSCRLLARCFEGDREARDVLVRRHRDWLRGHVHRRMGDRLRGLQESDDVVQEVLLDLLQYGPTYVPANDEQFRGLLARMVLNRLRELDRYGAAGCRDLRRARALQSGETSRIGPLERSAARPDRRAAEREEAALVQVALGLIDVEDREIIDLHRFDGLAFAEIGARLGISPKAANKRCSRAIARLGTELRRLSTGDLQELVAEAGHDSDG